MYKIITPLLRSKCFKSVFDQKQSIKIKIIQRQSNNKAQKIKQTIQTEAM